MDCCGSETRMEMEKQVKSACCACRGKRGSADGSRAREPSAPEYMYQTFLPHLVQYSLLCLLWPGIPTGYMYLLTSWIEPSYIPWLIYSTQHPRCFLRIRIRSSRCCPSPRQYDRQCIPRTRRDVCLRYKRRSTLRHRYSSRARESSALA